MALARQPLRNEAAACDIMISRHVLQLKIFRSDIKLRRFVLFGISVLLVLVAGCFAWAYRTKGFFRNDVRAALFELSGSTADRKLLLLGDSRVVGMSCAGNFADWRVLNLGISGSKSDDWLDYVTTRGKLRHFDVAVIWVGINDILNNGRTGTHVARDVSDTIQNLSGISQRIILINPIDGLVGEAPKIPERSYQEVRVLANALASSANAYRFSILTPFASSPNISRSSLYFDAVHLNDSGYKILCAELERWLVDHE